MSTADGTVLGTTKIVDHGPNTQRWNLVILADGYRTSEMGTFAADAQAFVNRLFSVKPFNELQGCSSTTTRSGRCHRTRCRSWRASRINSSTTIAMPGRRSDGRCSDAPFISSSRVTERDNLLTGC